MMEGCAIARSLRLLHAKLWLEVTRHVPLSDLHAKGQMEHARAIRSAAVENVFPRIHGASRITAIPAIIAARTRCVAMASCSAARNVMMAIPMHSMDVMQSAKSNTVAMASCRVCLAKRAIMVGEITTLPRERVGPIVKNPTVA